MNGMTSEPGLFCEGFLANQLRDLSYVLNSFIHRLRGLESKVPAESAPWPFKQKLENANKHLVLYLKAKCKKK